MSTCPIALLGGLLTAIGLIAHLRSLHHRGVTIPLPPNVRSRNGYREFEAIDTTEEIS